MRPHDPESRLKVVGLRMLYPTNRHAHGGDIGLHNDPRTRHFLRNDRRRGMCANMMPVIHDVGGKNKEHWNVGRVIKHSNLPRAYNYRYVFGSKNINHFPSPSTVDTQTSSLGFPLHPPHIFPKSW